MSNVIHKGSGHRQRLRDKFLTSGLDGFQDYEIIELLLILATPRKDCKDQAKVAIKKFKTLQGVFEATDSELFEINGIGRVNIFGLKLIKAVAERYLKKKIIETDPVSNSTDLLNFLNISIRDKNQEYFVVIFLNSKNKVIAEETLFTGTLTSSSVYPREVVKSALDHRAASLIFAHNHPSGETEPSPEDVFITRQLFFACKYVGITVHEHLIIGNNKHYSFAGNGYFAQFRNEFGKQNN